MQITNQIYKILSQFSDLLLDFLKFFLSTFILTYSRTYRPLHSPRKVRMNYKNFRLDYRNINFIFQTLKPNRHGNKQFPGYALERCADRGRARIAGLDAPQRQLFDDTLVQAIAEQGAEVMHCATMLFLGMVDDATTFAETHGGGSGGSDLKWGRDEDEDNRAWALRCMRMASRMMRPAIGKKPKR